MAVDNEASGSGTPSVDGADSEELTRQRKPEQRCIGRSIRSLAGDARSLQ
jgi:hypothetical protein